MSLIKSLINSYPFGLPRFYVYLRTRILPLTQIEKTLPQSGLFLDIGCGYGIASLYFATTSKTRIVKAIEINPKRVEVAKSISKNIYNLHFDIDNLANHQHGHYDVITMIDLLHHLSKKQKNRLLKQCNSLLKHRGLLILKDINTTPLLKYLWNYAHDYLFTFGGKLEFKGVEETIKLLEKYNFKLVNHHSLESYFYPHILYVFQKR
ncbi:MAG: class I SAM-dependent methyltransferase [Candidatus Shapirobacteria bacterium]|jgi:2-polyprenyl-3-methyl-5-hydroxy-6-metoxy-1,4-benzoquinol methylase